MTLEQYLYFAQFDPVSFEEPKSWSGHQPFAAWIMQALKPNIFVELGTHSGNSYFSFCQSAKEISLKVHCFAVDNWCGDGHAGEYDEKVFSRVTEINQVNYSNFSKLLRTTFDKALDLFENHSINLLHIDGLHTYEAVKHDFESWLPKLAPGAIVLFHDIAVRDRDFGVWKLWDELTVRYPKNIQFSHCNGLGVLQIDGDLQHQELAWIFSAEEKSNTKKIVEAFGLKHEKLFNLKLEIDSLKKVLIDQHQNINNLNIDLCKKDAEIENLNHKINEKDVSIEYLNGVVHTLYNSRSWKITALFRGAFKQVKKVVSAVKLLRWLVNNYGGIKKITLRAFGSLRKGGIRGLMSGIRNLRNKIEAHSLTDLGVFDRNDYQEWIRRYDTIDNQRLLKIREEIRKFATYPKISLLMPVFDPPLEFLDKAIRSVRNQIYSHWQLCIADDFSKNIEVRKLLEKHAREDSRIEVVYRVINGHISQASNSALELVSGEWVALFDHDDLLPLDALFEVAKSVLENPNAAIIYSDEDKITEQGIRYSPYFKSDFNRELMLAQNMISHLGVFRVDLVKEGGGFAEGLEGSQDYDLALRILEKIKPTQVIHIPKILYHWRAIAGSTALESSQKNYAVDAGRAAVRQHLDRLGLSAIVTPAPGLESCNRVQFTLPKELPLISIIIPTRDRANILSTCISSILDKTTYPSFEIIIIDNFSQEDETHKYFSSLPVEKIRVIRDESEFNFSKLNNIGVSQANGEFLCLMNNDIEILTPDWIEEMLSFAQHYDVGCVGARLWYPNGTLQHGGVLLIGGVAGHAHYKQHKDSPGYFGRAILHQSFSAVTGACLMVRKKVYEEAHGLDEQLAVAFNDVDFCLRVRELGYRNIWTPYAEMIHHESLSRGSDESPERRRRFLGEINFMISRWGKTLSTDPSYNPNLTFEHEDFSLAWPPRAEQI